MAQKNVLGKGLASLLPSASSSVPPSAIFGPPADASPAVDSQESREASSVTDSSAQTVASRDRHMGISMISLNDIRPNRYQPRREFDDAAIQELAESIKSSGIIQPLVVRKVRDGFELIAGERRLRAAKAAGLKQVPIVIRRSTDKEALELALIENIQRQDLNCVDEALAYFQLIEEFSLKQEEVADRVGKDRATVANYLRLLRLPETILEDLKTQALSFGHGKALLGLDDADLRLRARKQILEKKLSVRETESLVDLLKNEKKESQSSSSSSKPTPEPYAERLIHLSRELARHWSTQVEIKGSDKRGKILIHYSSRQELDRILEGMKN